MRYDHTYHSISARERIAGAIAQIETLLVDCGQFDRIDRQAPLPEHISRQIRPAIGEARRVVSRMGGRGAIGAMPGAIVMPGEAVVGLFRAQAALNAYCALNDIGFSDLCTDAETGVY